MKQSLASQVNDPDKKKLLFITERFPPDIGGVARSASRTVGAFAKMGLEVEVLTWTRSLRVGERRLVRIEADGQNGRSITVHRVGMFGSLDHTLQYSLAILEQAHHEAPFDWIWGHYLAPAGFLAVLFGQLAGIPVSVSARGNDIDMLMFPPGDFARLKWTLERANSITTVSGDIARKVKVLLGTDRNSIRVIYNSVDSVVFQPGLPDAHLREKLGIHDNEVVLGFSGELRQKKGLNQMLTAFCEVRRHRPACLLVIGEVRSRDQPALATFAAQSPEDFNRLIITGHLEVPSEIARHLRLCDVFLQPSLWEGLPNALLEAMACGLLVLGSDAGGIREVVESGKSGFLLPRTELHRLGEAVLELLSMSKVQRQSIGHAARHHVCLNFSSDQENLCLQEVIHDLFPQC